MWDVCEEGGGGWIEGKEEGGRWGGIEGGVVGSGLIVGGCFLELDGEGGWDG